MYEALFVGRTPSPTSVAIMNGRIYKDSPTLFGTQPASCLTSASTVSMNSSTGISGRAKRLAELAKRKSVIGKMALKARDCLSIKLDSSLMHFKIALKEILPWSQKI
jgi:hypothetical protein